MTIRSYDLDGHSYWPKTVVGSEKIYAVEWDDFLTAENDTITLTTWTVPTGLTNMDDTQVGNQSRIKLSADAAGSHEVICEIETIEGVETQKFIQVMRLEVEAVT